MKKSIVKKTISRKLSTAQYESVDISVEIEEEISWDTIDERLKRTEQVSKVLIIDFVQTYNKVVDQLGVDRKLAVIKSK